MGSSEHALWSEALAKLRVHKKRGVRAVNKPLLVLMLLARAQRAEEGILFFSKVHEPLGRLLREFGPPRKSVHPEYPFWHLQSDGVWIVRDGQSLPLKQGGNSPTKRTLLDQEVVGMVPEPLWRALVESPALRDESAAQVLDSFWPRSLHDDILSAVGLEVGVDTAATPSRKRDPNFRGRVLVAYERRCAVCAYDGRLQGEDLALEAAHIKWHCYDGPDEISNGVLLCSFHHVAFDRGAIGLRDDRRVVVSKSVSGGPAVDAWLSRFHGEPLQGPRDAADRPDPGHVAWHQDQVFQKPARSLEGLSA